MSAGDERESLLDAAFLTRLEKLELMARKILAGELRGDLRTARRGSGSSFADHKRYSQGDDMRFLDWNVYSRSGELQIKQFDAEETLEVSILLDASGSMDFGSRNKFRQARRLAAALGYIGLNRSSTVLLTVLGGSSANAPRAPFRGRNQVDGLLRALDDARPGGGLDLMRAVRSASGKRRGRGIAIVVSDFFAESGYEMALRYLKHVGYQVAAVHVLDNEDLHPRLEGQLRLIDIESGRGAFGVLSKGLVEAYEAEVRTWCDAVERFCRANAMAYGRVDTTWSLERAIKSLLLQGGLLR